MNLKALLVVGICTRTAHAGGQEFVTVTMDGPDADPCKVLHDPTEEDDSDEGDGSDEDGSDKPAKSECANIATATFGTTRVAVFLVGPDASKAKGRHDGAYYLAVADKAGWLVAREPLTIRPYWREHGGGHDLIPAKPHLEALSLATGRVAIALDVPVDDLVDSCNDSGARQPAGLDPKACQAEAHKHVTRRLRELRKSPKLSASPVELVACGVQANGSWACIHPITSSGTHSPIVRFSKDGRLDELDFEDALAF